MAGTAAQRPWLASSPQEQQAGPAYGPPEGEDDSCSSELFQSDQFRLWCMKVIPCTKRFVHDWTICPFAHAGEKAVRRDPRLYNYTGIACPDMKKTGNCIRGEKCPYAHNVFEYWLHPTRYRTQLCNDGPTCRRSICFFAHSLEELRVPACKPYVSPEALARASLEAIQQNPHPLGQQLPNPVAAAAQQHAALTAINRGRGGPGAPRQGAPDAAGGLAANATPFVPGTGFQGPPGEPVRYSAPSGSLLSSGSPGAELHSMHSMASADFGGSLPHHYMQQQFSAQQGGHHQGAHPRWGGHGHSGGVPRAQYGSSLPSAGGPPAMRGGRGMPASAPADGTGMALAGAALRSHPQQGGGYPSAPLRGPSPTGTSQGSRPAYPSSFAALQQQPPQAFGSYSSVEQVPGGGGAGGSVHSAGAGARSAPSTHAASSTASEEENDASPVGSQPGTGLLGQQGSGRTSPAAGADDLAQSLASLKIALTQQQLAATAGSNHEVVISTLHQILKEAMAQQGVAGGPGGSAGASLSGSFGAGANGDPSAAMVAAACAAAAAQQQQLGGGAAGMGGAPGFCGSPNTAVGASFGSAPSTASSLTGSAPRFMLSSQDSCSGGANLTPADTAALAAAGKAAAAGMPVSALLSTSPDAIACYEAAMVAAAGGYTGVLPLSGAGLQQAAISTSPRSSGNSTSPVAGAACEADVAVSGEGI